MIIDNYLVSHHQSASPPAPAVPEKLINKQFAEAQARPGQARLGDAEGQPIIGLE